MNKQSVVLPGSQGMWGSYVSKYQPDSSKILDNMFTAGSKNFVTDQTGMIQKRQGGVQWNRTSFSEAAEDTYEAVFESGARHFLRVGGGVLSASTGTGLFDVITSGYSALGNFEWATYQNRSYGCNGVNAPQTYDIATSYGGVTYSFTTAKTKVMGAQTPASGPTAGAPSAGGAIPIGPHTYKITYMYYGSEESNGSVSSSIQTTTGGNQTIALTAIPVGGYGVTARNIYRDDNNGVYLLLDTISNNTATTYTDTLSIGATPTPIPQFNNVPPTFSKIALWLDSLFIAPSGETNGIRFSNSGAPDVFDPGNFVTCQSDDIVTALYVYNGKLYVFGLHSFGSIEGNTPDTFYYHNISNLIGCVDNRSIQVRSIVSVPTLWWLSDKGFYYSNGNTVEYGSDYIQDLVNLNLAQVNYATNKNTQTSYADFSGDSRTSGIDIDTNPGAVSTINPSQLYSTTADWNGGSSLTNVKTSSLNFIEAPTQFAPTLASGSLGGSTIISGSNVTLPSSAVFTGETSIPTNGSIFGNVFDQVAQSVEPSSAGTITSITITANLLSVYGGTATIHAMVWNDSLQTPGNVLYESGNHTLPADTSNHSFTDSVNILVLAGQRIWIGWKNVSHTGASTPNAVAGASLFNGTQYAEQHRGGTWISKTSAVAMATTYAFSQTPNVLNGSWTSQVYDSGGSTVISDLVVDAGTYPSFTTGTLTLYGSLNANMSGSSSQVVTTPNGTTAATLSGFRYWQVVLNLATTNNTNVPVMSSPVVKFNTTATWISQPIDTTTDNIGWGTLLYTGNIPLGTTATLTIATCTTQFGVYSAYAVIGSAAVQQWAKVKLVLTTTTDNVTSPSISSVVLNWSLSSTIISTIIDAGTIPAGFGAIQWEQTSLGIGTVAFYIRTAATSGGIPSATWVAVPNGEFPNLTAAQFMQWKLTLGSTPNSLPEITAVTVNWITSTGSAGIRCASLFYNKTYYVSVATLGATANDTLIQLDQFGNWRIQKDTRIGTFLSYFNTLYFTDGTNGLIFNGFIADTDNGTAIVMDVRTKAWNAENDLFLKVPRAFKITGLHTGTEIHLYYSTDRGLTWIEMLNEQGTFGYQTNTNGEEFVTLFVPNALTLNSGRTLMFRITSSDVFPCSIINYVPSFYSRKGRYLNNG